MKKLIGFIKHVIDFFMEQVRIGEIFLLADQLTYKLILAFFPFLILVITIITHFSNTSDNIMGILASTMPDEVMKLFSTVHEQAVSNKGTNAIITIVLFVGLYTCTTGFMSMRDGIVKLYDAQPPTALVPSVLTGLLLVVVFILALASMLVSLIFNDAIFRLLEFIFPFIEQGFYDFLTMIIGLCIISITVLTIYKLCLPKVRFGRLLPGSLTTVFAWFVLSKAFNIYVNNFYKMSALYGSLAGIFILMMWLNIISMILLIGSRINRMLYLRGIIE